MTRCAHSRPFDGGTLRGAGLTFWREAKNRLWVSTQPAGGGGKSHRASKRAMLLPLSANPQDKLNTSARAALRADRAGVNLVYPI